MNIYFKTLFYFEIKKKKKVLKNNIKNISNNIYYIFM